MYMRQLSVEYCKWSSKLLRCMWLGREKQVRVSPVHSTFSVTDYGNKTSSFKLSNQRSKSLDLFTREKITTEGKVVEGGCRSIALLKCFPSSPQITISIHTYIYTSAVWEKKNYPRDMLTNKEKRVSCAFRSMTMEMFLKPLLYYSLFCYHMKEL